MGIPGTVSDEAKFADVFKIEQMNTVSDPAEEIYDPTPRCSSCFTPRGNPY